jgi:hypothetical protein
MIHPYGTFLLLASLPRILGFRLTGKVSAIGLLKRTSRKVSRSMCNVV